MSPVRWRLYAAGIAAGFAAAATGIVFLFATFASASDMEHALKRLGRTEERAARGEADQESLREMFKRIDTKLDWLINHIVERHLP